MRIAVAGAFIFFGSPMTPVTSKPVRFSALGDRAQLPTIARLMTMTLENPGILSLAAGFTDNCSLPMADIAKVVEGFADLAGEPEFLQYGANQGRAGLRHVLAERLHREESKNSATHIADSMVITNGSQQALYLAMQVLCNEGDIVLVDRPSYFVFLEMLRGLGVDARCIPTDGRGLVDRDRFGLMLDRMVGTGEAGRLRAIYFVSYFSNPSGRCLTDSEKEGLAEELSQRGLVIPVLEDAAYRDLYFREPDRASSVLSLPAWDDFPKLYLSTLTKPFATGMKVGYGVCSDQSWLSKMLYAKGHHDFGTANFNQAVFEQVILNGGFDRQLEKVRPLYQQKGEALDETLRSGGLAELGWSWERPSGGLYLWLRGPEKLETGLDSAFCQACLETGVSYVPGDLCFAEEGPLNYVRLSFGVLQVADLRRAGLRFVEVARRFGF